MVRKINTIKRFNSSYDNERIVVVDLITKVNELIRKFNKLVGEINDKEKIRNKRK